MHEKAETLHILKVLFSSDSTFSMCNVSPFSCNSEVLQYQQIIHKEDPYKANTHILRMRKNFAHIVENIK